MNTIIFDMDGTLINSSKVITNSINFVRENIGLSKMSENEILKYVNTPNINVAKYLYGTETFSDEQTKFFEEYYKENCTKDIELYPKIDEVLKTLVNENKNLAVATNAFSNYAKEMLTHLNVNQYFEFIIGADNVENPKPHPEMILKVMKNLNASKDKTILIGDSHKDMLSAKGAGIKHLLVNWGFSNYNQNVLNEPIEILNHI